MKAMHDIEHFLRPGHYLAQLRKILDDPRSQPQMIDFVAPDLLKNANVAAGGVLPMCQDTGTAIIRANAAVSVLTNGRDEEYLFRWCLRRIHKAESAATRSCHPCRCGMNATRVPTCQPQIEIYADTKTGTRT